MAGGDFRAARKDPVLWGRLVENAVGAQLYWSTRDSGGELMYWRDRHEEVDFVVVRGRHATAVEVKSGESSCPEGGLAAFQRRYPESQGVLISRDRLEPFFSKK
jgi:predicted AAA+ superfamily ATPase